MSRDTEVRIPERGDRSVLGCRVSDEVQSRFGKFVNETFGNRRGAYGYAVEKAMQEYMNNDRYDRIESELKDVRETVAETNAYVRQLMTAEKEKGAFLEPDESKLPGSRREREDAVIKRLVQIVNGSAKKDGFGKDRLDSIIQNIAGVSSVPSKRDYRDSLEARGLVEVEYGTYKPTKKAQKLSEETEVLLE